MNETPGQKLSRMLALWRLAVPESRTQQHRALQLERHIILPARVAVILILFYSFQFSPWIRYVAYSLDVGVETVVSLFWIYVSGVLLGGLLLLGLHWIPLNLARGTILTLSLLDAVFLAGLALITGGYDSILYWVFVVLVVRNTFVEPLSPVQLILNAFTAACYLLAGVSDYVLAGSVDEPTRQMLGLTFAGRPLEMLLVRTILLLLVAVCGFGVQLLIERQRRAEAEAREFSLRESQLHSTGRLAAEIAHQLKNPLAIINNASYSLQRALSQKDSEVTRCAHIIREEIDRADRILTQVLDYARLAEGRLERLDVVEALEGAVAEVFPEGARFPVTIRRHYSANLPRLTMQRGHLREILMNLLTNARDVTPAEGTLELTLRSPDRGAVEVCIRDEGPGIPPEVQRRIFEAYYTTKPKGTGLGLAIVRNTIELYGGTIGVESTLGKGACFCLTFPATVAAPARA
jgi:signal transduction histidine kinase